MGTRSYIIFALIVLPHFILAQRNKIFIKGGFNIAKFTSENDTKFYDISSVVSFNTGIVATIPMSKAISFQPSLIISGKGAKTKGGVPPYINTYFDATTTPIYLELPLNIVYNKTLSNNKILFAGAGLYGAIGIGGNNKIEGSTASGGPFEGEKKISFKKEEVMLGDPHDFAGMGYMTREDFGISFTGGLRIKKILVSLDYGFGLKNIDRGKRRNNDETKNRTFSVSIGWQIL